MKKKTLRELGILEGLGENEVKCSGVGSYWDSYMTKAT